jgi:hypothetical protein
MVRSEPLRPPSITREPLWHFFDNGRLKIKLRFGEAEFSDYDIFLRQISIKGDDGREDTWNYTFLGDDRLVFHDDVTRIELRRQNE